jgi:hypothetical protein
VRRLVAHGLIGLEYNYQAASYQGKPEKQRSRLCDVEKKCDMTISN